MDCPGCEKKVRKAVQRLEGVHDVEVDMAQQKVTVNGDVEQKKVLKAVRRTGRRAVLWPQPFAGGGAGGRRPRGAAGILVQLPQARLRRLAAVRRLPPPRRKLGRRRHQGNRLLQRRERAGVRRHVTVTGRIARHRSLIVLPVFALSVGREDGEDSGGDGRRGAGRSRTRTNQGARSKIYNAKFT